MDATPLFEVSMRPLEIPTAAPIVWPHRLEIDYTTGPPTGTTYTTNGEMVSVPAGGMKWVVAHEGSVITGLGTTAEVGGATTYNSLLPSPHAFG